MKKTRPRHKHDIQARANTHITHTYNCKQNTKAGRHAGRETGKVTEKQTKEGMID